MSRSELRFPDKAHGSLETLGVSGFRVHALRTCCIGSRGSRFEVALTGQDATRDRASLCTRSVWCEVSSVFVTTLSRGSVVCSKNAFGRLRRVRQRRFETGSVRASSAAVLASTPVVAAPYVPRYGRVLGGIGVPIGARRFPTCWR
jgi:hypothetical protein